MLFNDCTFQLYRSILYVKQVASFGYIYHTSVKKIPLLRRNRSNNLHAQNVMKRVLTSA